MKLRNDNGLTRVEFGLQWRSDTGRWFSEVFATRADLEARRREIEPHATAITEHMRDRITNFTPWLKTSQSGDPEAQR